MMPARSHAHVQDVAHIAQVSCSYLMSFPVPKSHPVIDSTAAHTVIDAPRDFTINSIVSPPTQPTGRRPGGQTPSKYLHIHAQPLNHPHANTRSLRNHPQTHALRPHRVN